MWNEIIKCYIIMDKLNHAKDLILLQLEKIPTPELWCIYGDITANEEYYHKAWELSKEKYSRAQRSLGKCCVLKKDWKGAITHFQIALKINPQFAETWYTMGCCAMKIDELTLAASCFNRVVILRPDDGEAWNNLASCYIQQDKKEAAHSSLKEAIKYNSDSWRMWENLITVSLDIGEYFDVILGMHKMLELRDNYIDVQALALVTEAVIDDLKLGNTKFGTSMHKTLMDLMDLIVTKVSFSPQTWAIYAEYYKCIGDLNKSIEYRIKQCRNLQESEWNVEPKKFEHLVNATRYYVEDAILLDSKEIYYSLDLFLQSTIKQSKRKFWKHRIICKIRRITRINKKQNGR